MRYAKTLLFLLFFYSFSLSVFAQKQKADSLAGVLKKEKSDTSRAKYLWQIASYLMSYDPDSAIRVAQNSLFLSEKSKYTEGESRALGQMANGFLGIGNYPRALEFYLRKLKIEEKRKSPFNLASVTMNIGIVHVYQEEYPDAIAYFKRADSIIEKYDLSELRYNINLNTGDVYNRQKIADSAFHYFQRALDIAYQMQDGDFIGTAMIGLGHAHFDALNFQSSMNFYQGSLPYLAAANDEDLSCEALLGLSKLYYAISDKDSAVYYARASYELARKDNFQSRQMEAANVLTDLFNHMSIKDSALSYMQEARVLGDSINSREKIRESQIISINEQLRQGEIIESGRRAKEERAQQLQLLLIGIFIPALFLFTLLLSRVKIHVRIIRFLGVISLLILFEYLTLLLHPVVLNITNHTPFLELLIFVLIASMLIPAHHRIEHWLIERLTVRRQRSDKDRIKMKLQRLKIKTSAGPDEKSSKEKA